MIQDIHPRVYHCEYKNIPAVESGDIVLIYTEKGLVLRKDTGKGSDSFVRYGELTGGEGVSFRYLFTIDEMRFFTPETDFPQSALPESVEETPIFALMGQKEKWEAFAGIMGNSLSDWYRTVQYCGRCGVATAHSETERAAVCPECGLIIYPRISPVVIVAVANGDKLLLTRYVNGHHKRYALVAGFCETGETLEDTVQREVFEETGVRVKNLRYYKSQPWGLSNSLLCGFFCELDGDDTIHVDKTELAEAVWLSRAEIPPSELDVALTAEMMELFRTGGGS